MGLSNLFGRKKDDISKEYPAKIKPDAIKESKKSMEKIEDATNEWMRDANRKGIVDKIASNPDFIIKKIIEYAIESTQESNAFTSDRIVNDIKEEGSLDSADLTVALMVMNERNQIIKDLHFFSKLQLIPTEQKRNIAIKITKLIGLCEGIKNSSKISRRYYYGWTSYFDPETNIRLSKINSMIFNFQKSVEISDIDKKIGGKEIGTEKKVNGFIEGGN